MVVRVVARSTCLESKDIRVRVRRRGNRKDACCDGHVGCSAKKGEGFGDKRLAKSSASRGMQATVCHTVCDHNADISFFSNFAVASFCAAARHRNEVHALSDMAGTPHARATPPQMPAIA